MFSAFKELSFDVWKSTLGELLFFGSYKKISKNSKLPKADFTKDFFFKFFFFYLQYPYYPLQMPVFFLQLRQPYIY